MVHCDPLRFIGFDFVLVLDKMEARRGVLVRGEVKG
jgi:hypothetical protein